MNQRRVASKRRKLVERPVSLFTKPGQVARLVLADGFRFMILVKGEPPTMVPIDEPGEYCIDIPEMLAKGKYPVGIMTIDLAHVPIFEKITAAMVDQLLDAAMQAELAA